MKTVLALIGVGACVLFGCMGPAEPIAAVPGVVTDEDGNALEGVDPLRKVLSLPQTKIGKGMREFDVIVKDEATVAAIKKRWASIESASKRIHLLKVLAALGVQSLRTQSRRTDISYRGHGWLRDSEIVDILIQALDDKSRHVRVEATRLLRPVPDDMLRSRGLPIVAHVKKRGNTDAIRLLGRTLCAEARELLLRDDRFRKCSEYSTNLALAKLGDAKIERQLIKDFLSEARPRKKARLAHDLGYVGSPGAVAALASELRSPIVVRGGAYVSLRVRIISSLSRALPENELFWEPRKDPTFKEPTSDAYYEKIERWAEEVMMIQWRRDRPPFFYSMPIPHPPVPTNTGQKNRNR